MVNRIERKRIAFLATNGVEQSELTTPMEGAAAEGAIVEIVSTKLGRIQAMKSDDKGDTFDVHPLQRWPRTTRSGPRPGKARRRRRWPDAPGIGRDTPRRGGALTPPSHQSP